MKVEKRTLTPLRKSQYLRIEEAIKYIWGDCFAAIHPPLPYDKLVARQELLTIRYGKYSENDFNRFLHANGFKIVPGRWFRRNYPLANRFFGDYVWPEKKLVVELDGPIHESSKQYDRRRDTIIRSLGFKVFRLNSLDQSKWLEIVPILAQMEPATNWNFMGKPERHFKKYSLSILSSPPEPQKIEMLKAHFRSGNESKRSASSNSF